MASATSLGVLEGRKGSVMTSWTFWDLASLMRRVMWEGEGSIPGKGSM